MPSYKPRAVICTCQECTQGDPNGKHWAKNTFAAHRLQVERLQQPEPPLTFSQPGDLSGAEIEQATLLAFTTALMDNGPNSDFRFTSSDNLQSNTSQLGTTNVEGMNYSEDVLEALSTGVAHLSLETSVGSSLDRQTARKERSKRTLLAKQSLTNADAQIETCWAILADEQVLPNAIQGVQTRISSITTVIKNVTRDTPSIKQMKVVMIGRLNALDAHVSAIRFSNGGDMKNPMVFVSSKSAMLCLC